MKKIIFTVLVLFNFSVGFAQTTATNFNCNDCAGSNHDLFTELNAGKVVVLCWVMPCGSCIAPSRTAYDAVQGYTTSNPGRVVFYLVDDYANTPCNTLTSWGNTNGMPNAVKFSNSGINPADYGNVGMPKIIVLGGSNHTIFYNEDDGNNLPGIVPAINLALAATNINEKNNAFSSFNVFINAENNFATVIYDLNRANAVNIEIYEVSGKKIKSLSFPDQVFGKHSIQIDLGQLRHGMYLLKFSSGGITKITKFIIVG